ncbi:MAG: TVP38/TMEM64 family protein [Rhodospirillales bacterium]|nr:TVP38/TMEM64 family protein [Rhodospirillales bacterium]
MNTELALKIARGLVMLLVLVGAGVAIKTTDLGAMLDEQWVDAHIRGQGLTGQLLYLAIAAGFATVGFPRQIISFMGGYAFGLVEGTALALLATILGCIITFTFARLIGRELVASKMSGRVEKIDRFLGNNPFSMALLIRLMPAGSNVLTSLCAGVSSARGIMFVAGSALGFIPQTFIFALAGTGVNVDPGLRLAISAGLFVVSVAMGAYLYRRYRRHSGSKPLEQEATPS